MQRTLWSAPLWPIVIPHLWPWRDKESDFSILQSQNAEGSQLFEEMCIPSQKGFGVKNMHGMHISITLWGHFRNSWKMKRNWPQGGVAAFNYGHKGYFYILFNLRA